MGATIGVDLGVTVGADLAAGVCTGVVAASGVGACVGAAVGSAAQAKSRATASNHIVVANGNRHPINPWTLRELPIEANLLNSHVGMDAFVSG